MSKVLSLCWWGKSKKENNAKCIKHKLFCQVRISRLLSNRNNSTCVGTFFRSVPCNLKETFNKKRIRQTAKLFNFKAAVKEVKEETFRKIPGNTVNRHTKYLHVSAGWFGDEQQQQRRLCHNKKSLQFPKLINVYTLTPTTARERESHEAFLSYYISFAPSTFCRYCRYIASANVWLWLRTEVANRQIRKNLQPE